MKWYQIELDNDQALLLVMKINTGYLVKHNDSMLYINDPEHLSFELQDEAPAEPQPEVPVEDPVSPEPEAPVVDEPEVPVDPTPVEPAPTPVDPEPTPPVEPTPVEEYVVIYDDGLRNGWKNYSWAATDVLAEDSYEGHFAILVDADNWDALNFYHADGFNTDEYTAIDFAIKAQGDGSQDIILALSVNYSNVAYVSLKSLFDDGKLPTTYETVRVNFADFGGDGLFITNILFQGENFGNREPFLIDAVRLVKNTGAAKPVPEPIPEGPIVTPEPVDGWLYTEGNKIYNFDGTVWQGKGANLMDTRGCWSCAWSRPNVTEVKRRVDALMSWGADFIRLCMETDSSAGVQNKNALNDPEYMDDLKEIVDYIGLKGGRVLLSVWIDPSLSTQGWPTSGTNELLKAIANKFKDTPYVMFGVSNEPEYNFDGSLDSKVHAAMLSAVRAIREIEDANGTPHHLVSVQGTGGWARNLAYYVKNPIPVDNVVYEVHVYDPVSLFDSMFVKPSETLPVIIGEFGPINQPGIATMSLDDCKALMNQADQKQISYLAWTFHMRCPPNLLVDNSGGGCGEGMPLEPTEWGLVLKQHLSQV